MLNKANIGLKRIGEQHLHLEKLLSRLKTKVELDNHFGRDGILDQLFIYLFYHLEYENSVIRLESNHRSEHIHKHHEMITEFTSFFEKKLVLGEQKFFDYLKNWQGNHYDEYDSKLDENDVLKNNHVLKSNAYTGALQSIVFENGIFTVVYGVINGDIVKTYLEVLRDQVKDNFKDKPWFSIQDLRHWDYATTEDFGNVDILKERLFEHNELMVFISENNQLTSFIINKITNKLGKDRTEVNDFHEAIKCTTEKNLHFGKVVDTFTIGDFYFIDHFYKKKDNV